MGRLVGYCLPLSTGPSFSRSLALSLYRSLNTVSPGVWGAVLKESSHTIMATITAAAKALIAVLHIDGLLQFRCCGSVVGDAEPDMDVRADSGGAQLAKWSCDLCGSEYLFGIIARTREESAASEIFEPVSVEELREIGVDTNDYEPSADEVKMCAKCDTTTRTTDWCNGCKEFVCSGCREYNPVNRARHFVSDHWTAPAEQEKRDEADAAVRGDGLEFEAEG